MKQQTSPQARIFVCINEKSPEKPQCSKGEGEKIVLWLKDEVKKRDLTTKLWINRTKCLGYCDSQGTSVIFHPTNEQFSSVKFEDVPHMFEKFLRELDLVKVQSAKS